MKKKTRFRKLKVAGIIILFLGISIVMFDHVFSSASYKKGDIRMKRIKNSPQYNDGKFYNPVDWKQPSFGEYGSILWDFVFGGAQRTPRKSPPTIDVDLAGFNNPGSNQLRATWLGHSSLMVNIDGYKILIDPVFQERLSIFGPSRYNGKVPLNLNRLSQIDIVIISHNHYDHLNKYSIQFLSQRAGIFLVPLGVGAQLERWGINFKKIVEMDWWDEFPVDENIMIAATPAQHFSGRSLSDRDQTLWVSWVIKGPYHKIFFSGDSGYFKGFKQIGDKYGPFDMTFIECGAYNEKWHHVHMFPEETVQAHIDLKGNVLNPIHWATFNLSLHSWYEPMKRLTAAAELSKIKTTTPVVGDTIVYNVYLPTEKWWEQTVLGSNQHRQIKQESINQE